MHVGCPFPSLDAAVAPSVIQNVFEGRDTGQESVYGTSIKLMDHQTTLGELIPCGGGDPVPLLKPKLLIGRRSSCDISLGFPNVSSHHCQLELINGYWNIRDLNSRNGIKVNGVRCDSRWVLPGDEVSIAKHRYEVVYSPDTDAPPPAEEDPFAISLMEKAGLARRDRQDERRRSLPPAAKPRVQPPTSSGSDSDDEVLSWLSGDEDAPKNS